VTKLSMEGKGSGDWAYMAGIEVGNAVCEVLLVVVVVWLGPDLHGRLKCVYSVERWRMRRTRQSLPPL